jgi:hypothetical protein
LLLREHLTVDCHHYEVLLVRERPVVVDWGGTYLVICERGCHRSSLCSLMLSLDLTRHLHLIPDCLSLCSPLFLCLLPWRASIST